MFSHALILSVGDVIGICSLQKIVPEPSFKITY